MRLPPLGAVALLLAAGCAGSETAGRAAGGGDELLLTSSLSGEQCRIRNTPVPTGARRLEQFEISCAGWEEPSGLIWRMPQLGQSNLAEMLVVALTTGTFERYARSGARSNAEALRQAELALLDQPATAHPALWAPFVLVGDGGPRAAPGA